MGRCEAVARQIGIYFQRSFLGKCRLPGFVLPGNDGIPAPFLAHFRERLAPVLRRALVAEAVYFIGFRQALTGCHHACSTAPRGGSFRKPLRIGNRRRAP